MATAHPRKKTHRTEYNIWSDLITRCENPKYKDYKNYGGRGITVCQRWRSSFANFFADMGHRPSPKHSIDRIDNNGNYEPSNCRWATRLQQNRNKRNLRLISHDGLTLSAAEWSERTGIHSATIRDRIDAQGWTVEKALSVPSRHQTFFEYQGLSLTLGQWSKRLGISRNALKHRIKYNWPIDKIFVGPPISKDA